MAEQWPRIDPREPGRARKGPGEPRRGKLHVQPVCGPCAAQVWFAYSCPCVVRIRPMCGPHAACWARMQPAEPACGLVCGLWARFDWSLDEVWVRFEQGLSAETLKSWIYHVIVLCIQHANTATTYNKPNTIQFWQSGNCWPLIGRALSCQSHQKVQVI